MPAHSDLTTVRAELQHLQQRRPILSDALASQAAQLRSAGALPPDDVLAELLQYRSRLTSLATELELADEPNSPATANRLTLDTLQFAITTRELNLRGRSALTRIDYLSHVDDPAFGAVHQCQAQAKQLIQDLGANSQNADPNGLDNALRPFEALLTLLDAASELPDAEWTACHDLICATWGRSMSAAVARGKIRLTPPIARDLIPETSVVEVAAATSGAPIASPVTQSESFSPVPAEVADGTIVLDNQQELVFETVGRPGTERTPSHNYRALDLKLLSETPYEWARPQGNNRGGMTSPSTNGLRTLARRALETDPLQRGQHVSQLVLHLLWDDRPVLAYHLARTLEGFFEGLSSIPPTWLMHALTLSRHVCYSQGEIARLLERDLDHFQPELIYSDRPDRDTANGFFIRAAALLPALLTASPAAARIIKTFRIVPGLTRLYNYCSRIQTYGQEFQGRATDLFTPDCDLHEWTDEMDSLQQSIEDWLPDVISQHCAVSDSTQLYLHANWTLAASTAMRHERAAYHWSKWQEVLRIVVRILTPVRTGDLSERNWVKTEVERLTQHVRLEIPASQRATEPPIGVLEFPDESMLKVIREAIDYANRWLRLCASKPGEGRTLASRDAEILRDEILQRTDDVLEELAAYNATHETLSIKAAIACLCRTIEHLRLIFSPHSTLALREADPRDVLCGDLLNIPQLELDTDGLPTLPPNKLLVTLLTHLRDRPLDASENLPQRSFERPRRSTMNAPSLTSQNDELQPVATDQQPTELGDCCFD